MTGEHNNPESSAICLSGYSIPVQWLVMELGSCYHKIICMDNNQTFVATLLKL